MIGPAFQMIRYIGTLLEPKAASSEATRQFVTLELFTDEGLKGIGITFFGGPLTGALRKAVEALGALVIGKDALRVEEIAASLRKAASNSGPGGIFTLALSAIDIALWDIKGKALGQPLFRPGGFSRLPSELRARKNNRILESGKS